MLKDISETEGKGLGALGFALTLGLIQQLRNNSVLSDDDVSNIKEFAQAELHLAESEEIQAARALIQRLEI